MWRVFLTFRFVRTSVINLLSYHIIISLWLPVTNRFEGHWSEVYTWCFSLLSMIQKPTTIFNSIGSAIPFLELNNLRSSVVVLNENHSLHSVVRSLLTCCHFNSSNLKHQDFLSLTFLYTTDTKQPIPNKTHCFDTLKYIWSYN